MCNWVMIVKNSDNDNNNDNNNNNNKNNYVMIIIKMTTVWGWIRIQLQHPILQIVLIQIVTSPAKGQYTIYSSGTPK